MLHPISGGYDLLLPLQSGRGLDTLIARLGKEGPQEGRVLQNLSGGETEINVGGRIFALRLGRTLPEGTQFLARLVDGRLILNIQPQPGRFAIHRQVFDTATRNPGLEVTIRSLPGTLQEMGLDPRGPHVFVAQAMVAAGLPLSTEVLEKLRRQCSPLSSRDLPALTLALRKGIPISREMLDTLGRMLEETEDLHTVLRDLGSLPDSDSDLSSGLETLVARSGVFHEGSLAGGTEPEDLKTLLLRTMAEDPESDSGRLAGKALDILSRFQLHSLPEMTTGEKMVFIPVPLRLTEEVTTLQVGVRSTGSSPEDTEFEVVLGIPLTGLGFTWGTLRMDPAGRLAVSLYAESEVSRKALGDRLEELRGALSGRGVPVLSLGIAKPPKLV